MSTNYIRLNNTTITQDVSFEKDEGKGRFKKGVKKVEEEWSNK